ncbi:MAG TPA: ATP-binding protein [Candidatus Krumholzibacteria bacterium]|nr:ATP-binding protein [Candidatus Krumholzibacteria bacterium]
MRRISTRLAASFLLVALLPTIPLSLVVRDLLERRFGPAIADPLEAALTAGVDESRAHLQALRGTLQAAAPALAGRGGVVLLDDFAQPRSAAETEAYLAERPDLAARANAVTPSASGAVDLPERIGDTLLAVVAGADGPATAVLLPLPEGMVDRARTLTDGLGLLRAVRGEQGRVVLSFVGPFLLVYGVLIAVALGAGMLWSRSMVTPLETLVGATRRVAGGDLEFRVEARGPGEVGELVRSFDAMIGRLAEQRRDLARLERAAAWRGMARTLAHEVKNPLTPILLAVQTVRDGYRGDDPAFRALVDECAEIVGEEVEQLRRLVRDFGEFARLPRPDLREGDLADVVRDLGQLYGARVAVAGTESAARGWFDAGAVRRALINLVDNGLAACRDADRSERVTLRLRPVGAGAAVEVQDGGVGIPADRLERIFEPDFTTRGDGMGLGLAVVQGIAAGHGGTIRVASVPGEGSVFTLELPLTRPGGDAAGADPNEEGAA